MRAPPAAPAGIAGVALLALGCAAPGDPPPGTYADVRSIFATSCGFASCHGGNGVGAGGLYLLERGGAPITSALVGVPSCQYDLMPRVAPGDPAASWLWQKLTGPRDAEGHLMFEPAPAWSPAPDAACPPLDDGVPPFGRGMPRGTASRLSDDRLDRIELWILDGAPGPEEP